MDTPHTITAKDFLEALIHGWNLGGSAIIDGPYLVERPEGWTATGAIIVAGSVAK